MPDHPRITADILDTAGIDNLLTRLKKHRDLLSVIQGGLPDALHKHCKDCVADGTRLVLFAESPVWAFQLRFHAPSILNRLREEHGLNYRNIEIRSLPPTEQRRPGDGQSSMPTARAAAAIGACADQAGTEELKKSLERLAVTLKRRARAS